MTKQDSDVKDKVNQDVEYRSAENYEIILFSTNNTATNIYNFMMGFVSYYAVGVAGLAVVLISTLLTAMRIFDGVVDPFLGYIIDKTDGKFGKFRPYLWLGNLMMIGTIVLLFQTTHLIPENFRLIYFLVIYGVYIIGYSFQTTVTKTGQNVITNDPKKRPLFSMYDGIFTTVFYALAGLYVSNYLSPKYGGEFNQAFFSEFSYTFMVISVILTILATIGIWKKDRTEYFGTGNSDQAKKLRIKDYVKILKANRPLQMLTLAASSDKLGSKIKSNSISGVILFGIIIGDYALSGQIGALTIIPGILFNIGGAMVAQRFGQKRTYVLAQGSAFVFYGLIALLLVFGDPTSISLSNLNLMTILFVILTMVGSVQATGDAMQISMISDVTDYETARSGKYVPGLIGTIFSFVDNFVSSFSNSLVGFAIAFIGYTTVLPEVGDALNPQLLIVGLGLYFGAPMISWIIALTAMKFYSLDSEKMIEVQQTIQMRREKGLIAEEDEALDIEDIVIDMDVHPEGIEL